MRVKWGFEQHLPPFRRESVESVKCRACAGRLDFMHRRGASEDLAPPEVALVARRGSLEASGPQN